MNANPFQQMSRNAFINIGLSTTFRGFYTGPCFLEQMMGGQFFYKAGDFIGSDNEPYVKRVTFGQFEDFLEKEGIDIVCEPNRKEKHYTFLIFQTKDGETKWLKDLKNIYNDKQHGYEMTFQRCIALLKNNI